MVRRRREWQDVSIQESTSAGSQSNQTLTLGAGIDQKGLTMTRLILGLSVGADVLVANSVDQTAISLGIGIFSDDVISGGSFPDPADSSDIPAMGWLWRYRALITEGGGVNSQVYRIDVDLRSQRKLMYGRPVLVIANNTIAGAAFGTKVTGWVRGLYLLP